MAVRGAEPGDVLEVEILAIETDDFGSTGIFPGFGLLGDLFEEPYLVTWGLHDGSATSGRLEGIRIPADAFVGVIGVAPSPARMEQFRAREAALIEAGGVALPPNANGAVPPGEPYASTALRTIPPRETGGNLDVPQARAGSTVFLPVDVPGALLSLGDVHFAQGDGEVCGTAIEAHGRVTIRVDVLPAGKLGYRPQTPAFESVEPAWKGGRRHFVTTGLPIRPDGSNADMDTTLAARNALLAMIDWLGAERGLSRDRPTCSARSRSTSASPRSSTYRIRWCPRSVRSISSTRPLRGERHERRPRTLRTPGHRLSDRLRRRACRRRRRLPAGLHARTARR